MIIRNAILKYLIQHPNADSRQIISIFASQFRVTKQAISGHLSCLKKNKQILITTHIVGKYSTAV